MGDVEKSGAPAAVGPVVSKGRARLCGALLVLMGFALGCSEFVVIGIESDLSRELGVSLDVVGQLISLYSLAYAVMTPALALATGRFKRYAVMLSYLVLFVVGNAISAFAPNFGVLLASRILLGSISGALLAVGVTFTPELVGPKRASGLITLIYSSYSVAMILSTSMGKMLASTVGWQVAMYVNLALSVGSSVLLAVFMPRTGATDEPASAREQLRLLSEPCIVSGMLVFVFGIGSTYIFYGYVTPYLEQVLGMDAPTASVTLMVYGGVTFVSSLMGGWLDRHFGLRAMLVTFLIQALVLVGLYLAGSNTPVALAMVMLIALLMYLSEVPSISNFMGVANRRYPKALTLASSLEPLSFNVGIFFGTFVGGRVVVGPGIRYVGVVGAAFALLAIVLVVVTLRLSERERARDIAEERAR